jgi:hypothetical protein
VKAGVQRALYCRCGNEKILAPGLCATCYTLKRQDEEYFGGLREAVLDRDGYCCRVEMKSFARTVLTPCFTFGHLNAIEIYEEDSWNSVLTISKRPRMLIKR